MAAKKRTRKAKPKPVKRKAEKLGDTGDAMRNGLGQFAPGHPNIGGRPKGIDYRKVCQERAEAEGYDLEEAIWRVTKELIQNAEGRPAVLDGEGKVICPATKGSTKAQALLFDRQCDPQRQELDVTQTATITHITDQDRNAIRDMAADPDTQRVVRAELRKKTRGNGQA